METKNILGIMSGTSCDGIDLCLCTFTEQSNKYNYTIIETMSIDYSDLWKNRLNNAFYLSGLKLKELEFDFTWLQIECVKTFQNKYPKYSIDYISTHGHTVFHNPNIGYTHQITLGGLLAEHTKITTICNFREQDVFLGGQGAPLVPIGDKFLFYSYDACINLGGFANISFENKNTRFAFDLCPFNILLNRFCASFNVDFDESGHIAKQGEIIEPLLNILNKNPYYSKKFPKSLSVEDLENNFLNEINIYINKPKDILRTLVEHFAIIISNEIVDCKNILLTGGGTFHLFFVDRLTYYYKGDVCIPSKELINFKEALIFAFLGYLRLRNKTNILSSVTGSRTNHSSGQIYYPIR